MQDQQQLQQLLKEAIQKGNQLAVFVADRAALESDMQCANQWHQFADRALPFATLQVDEPPFPSNWAIRRNVNNANMLNLYFNRKYGTEYFNDDLIFHNTDDRSKQLCGKLIPGFVLITDEQFVKHVFSYEQD